MVGFHFLFLNANHHLHYTHPLPQVIFRHFYHHTTYQNLHQDKLFDVNISKMASYAVKSATRYKHSFIGSDVGNELMLQSELAGLIGLYDQIQKRNWRALMFTHTVGSGQKTVLSNKETHSSN